MAIDRPLAGGDIALNDDSLAKIGLAVVYEASAKARSAAALRALSLIDEEGWKKLERKPFDFIIKKLLDAVMRIGDSDLSERFEQLREAVSQHHEIRHIVVHVPWGHGGDGFVGYDYSRRVEVTSNHIDRAVIGCAEILRAASWFTLKVANLVEDGALPERGEGAGVSVRTETRLVRL